MRAIVFVGGWGSFDTEWRLSPLFNGAKAKGIEPFIFKKPLNGFGSIQESGKELLSFCEELREKGYDQIDLVGHSMGGLVCRVAEMYARTYMIRTITTLGTPHYGTVTAGLAWWSKSARQMKMLSSYIKKMHQYHHHNARILCIGGRFDLVVIPSESAYLERADKNVTLNETHISMVLSPFVARDVLDFIR